MQTWAKIMSLVNDSLSIIAERAFLYFLQCVPLNIRNAILYSNLVVQVSMGSA